MRGAGAAVLLCVLVATGPAAAEPAWVQGAPLNLRAGAGNQYRILGVVRPGEAVEVLGGDDEWTRIRTGEGRIGWISAGFLAPVAPPDKRVAQLESELARVRTRLESTGAEAERLRTRSTELSDADESQRSEIERLTEENLRLRAGERWLEWLVGALILSLGMVAGAILSRVGGRRSARRIRL